MAKKVMIGVIAGVMILVIGGFIRFFSGFTTASGSAEEKIVMDSQGNSYEVVKTVTKLNGDKTEFIKGAPCEIINKTGQAITGVYIVNSSDDGWGNNLLMKDGGIAPVEDGDRMCGVTLSYNPEDTTFDIKIDREDGKSAEFNDCSLKDLDDPMHVELEFTTNEDGTNKLNIC